MILRALPSFRSMAKSALGDGGAPMNNTGVIGLYAGLPKLGVVFRGSL